LRLSSADRSFPLTRVQARLALLPPPTRIEAGDARGPPRDGAARESAVLVVLFEEDGETRLVLTRRAEHLATHRGQVAFPGGKVDPSVDGDARDAALREAQEEVGLAPVAVEVVAELDHLASVGGPFVIAPFVGVLTGRPELVASPAEVDRVFDVALADLLVDGVFHEERWEVAGRRRRVYFFDLADETVWGATAQVLADLLAHLTGVALPT
jgi:8-oxo-dGTP pyrophosphatase MutT (NUDIX family)